MRSRPRPRSAPPSPLVLTDTGGNESAIRLYESVGFEAFGIEPRAILTPAGFRSKVHMWRAL